MRWVGFFLPFVSGEVIAVLVLFAICIRKGHCGVYKAIAPANEEAAPVIDRDDDYGAEEEA